MNKEAHEVNRTNNWTIACSCGLRWADNHLGRNLAEEHLEAVEETLAESLVVV